MSIFFKIVLVVLNIVMCAIAISWYQNHPDYEPLTVLVGQFITILGLACDVVVTRVKTERVKNNSELDVTYGDGDQVTTTDIDNSKIRISKKNERSELH